MQASRQGIMIQRAKSWFLYSLCLIGLSLGLGLHFKQVPLRILVTMGELVCLGIIFETDRRKRQIYLVPVLCLGLVGLIDQLLIQHAHWWVVGSGLVFTGLFFGLQHFFSKGKGLGVGDVYLGLALGMVFGGARVMAVILLAYVLGSIISLLFVMTGKWQRTEPIPLGSFLALSGVCLLFFDHPWSLLGF